VAQMRCLTNEASNWVCPEASTVLMRMSSSVNPQTRELDEVIGMAKFGEECQPHAEHDEVL